MKKTYFYYYFIVVLNLKNGIQFSGLLLDLVIDGRKTYLKDMPLEMTALG